MKQKKLIKVAVIFFSILLYFGQSGKIVFAAPPNITITIAGETLAAVGGTIGDNEYEATVQWSSDATSCTISPGNYTGTSGSQDIIFYSDVTYTATCTGPGGTASDSATLIVPDGSFAPVSVTAPNSTVTLNWTSSHSPDTCRVLDGISKNSNLITTGGATGSVVVSNVSEGDDFGLECEGGNPIERLVICDSYCLVAGLIIGSGSGDPGDPYDPVTGDIKCQNSTGTLVDGPCAVSSGGSTYISWDSSGATDCEVRVGSNPSAPLFETGPSGYYSTNILTTSKTYTLSCDGGLGVMQLIDSVTVNVISATLQVSSNTSNNNGPFVDGPLDLPATGVQVRLKATCGVSNGSGKISPGNINFSGASHYVNVNFNTSPKTWTLTCYPNSNQQGSPTATDFVTVQLNTPNFALTCTTLSKSVAAGQSTVFDTSLSYSNGFSSPVTVSITLGLPSGATSSPVTVTPPSTIASVPVQTVPTTSQGTSVLTFTAASGSLSDTCTSQLIVTPPDAAPVLDSLVLTPETSIINIGETVSYTAVAWYTDGTDVNVTLNPATQFASSDKSIASMSGHIATGEGDGTATITAQYTEGAITVADTASLQVGADSGVSASLYCPAGSTQKVCTINSGSSISLGWSSSGADDCSTDPALVPPASATSGSASTGNLSGPQTIQYTLTCTGGGKGISATDTATVIVSGPGSSLVESDKDITYINGKSLVDLGLPAPSACSAGTDSVGNVTFKEGDIITFRICIKNSGDATATSITLADQMTNLAEPATGFNVLYQGAPIAYVYDPDTGTIDFTIPGSIAAGNSTTLTFDAKVTKPTGSSSFTLYRFQNRAVIDTAESSDHTVTTPLYLFYAGTRVPSKEEVAP